MTGAEEKREGSGQRGKRIVARCTNAGLPYYCRHVALMLLLYEDKQRRAWPSQDRLAGECGLDRRTIRKALRRLVDAGIVAKISHREGEASEVYQLVDTTSDLKPIYVPPPTRRKHRERSAMGHTVLHQNRADGSPRAPSFAGVMGPRVHVDGSPGAPPMGHRVTPKDVFEVPIEETTPLPPVGSATVREPEPTQPTRAALPKTAPRAAQAARESTEGGFGVLEALQAVHAASRGTFPKFERVHLSGAHDRALRRLLEDFPDRTDWTVLGEHLATGAYDRWGVLGLPWLIRYARSAIGQAKDWKQRQQPPKRSPGPARVTRAQPTPQERAATLRILRDGMEGLRQRALRGEERTAAKA